MNRRSPHWPQWPLLAVLLLGIVALAAVWFAITRPFSSQDDQEVRRYTEAIVGTPSRVNPLFASLNDVDRDLVALIFSGLTRLGPTGEVLPDLAQSWQVSDDGRTYTFRLRPGLTWHTGSPLTSEDVLFTYTLLADPSLKADPALGQLWRQLSCRAPDPLTVQCQLPEPFAPFLTFTTIGILPKLPLEGTDASSLFDSRFNQAPVGSGPFRLALLDQTRAVLKANPNYYLGPPNLDEIELRFFPDHSTATAALRRGEVDGLLLGTTASPEDLQTLNADDRLRSYTTNRTSFTLLYLNNIRPPFDDLRVRQAMAHTIDVDAIISNLLEGRAVHANSPIVPGTWASNPDLEPYPHDLGKARNLLDEAGWLEKDGSRQKDSVELRLTIMTDQDPLRTAIAEEIAGQLQKVGIQATVAPQGATELVRDFLVPHQYQAAVFGWDPGADPDPYPAWHSSQTGDQGRNLAGYFSEKADKDLEEARQTTDLSRRQALYFAFQKTFYDDVPSILLYYPVFTYFVSKEINGIRLGILFDPASRFANVQEWTPEKDSKLLRQ